MLGKGVIKQGCKLIRFTSEMPKLIYETHYYEEDNSDSTTRWHDVVVGTEKEDGFYHNT